MFIYFIRSQIPFMSLFGNLNQTKLNAALKQNGKNVSEICNICPFKSKNPDSCQAAFRHDFHTEGSDTAALQGKATKQVKGNMSVKLFSLAGAAIVIITTNLAEIFISH